MRRSVGGGAVVHQEIAATARPIVASARPVVETQAVVVDAALVGARGKL